MTRFPIIAAILLVTGCGGQAETNATSNEAVAAAPAAEPAAAVPQLEGNWRLTKVDGRPLEPGTELPAAFAGGKVRLGSGCLRRAWAFTQDRNIVGFTAQPGSSNCESPPSVRQEAAFHALDKATMAIFADEGREASLSGNGGNVTLVRN